MFPARNGGGMEAVIDGPIMRQAWLLPALACATICPTILAAAIIGRQRRATRLAGGRGRS